MTGTTLSDLRLGPLDVKLSNERQHVALECTWEITALSRLLVNAPTPNEELAEYVVRGLAARIEDLAGVIMAALGDEVRSTAELAKELRRVA